MSALIDVDALDGVTGSRQRSAHDIVLMPPEQWHGNSGHGLLLGVDVEPEARFVDAPLIAIDFPVFHDGRGLSLAVLLRSRIGFTGELRAVGDVHPELFHYLRRCGFDSLVLPPGRSLASADTLLAPYSDYYQASIADPRPAFRRRRRGV
jgi:uncharacterized protein (DUF934 family)